MRWPRWTRRHQRDDRGWPGPPAPLPGRAGRDGDTWTDGLSARLVSPWDEPTMLLPVVRP